MALRLLTDGPGSEKYFRTEGSVGTLGRYEDRGDGGRSTEWSEVVECCVVCGSSAVAKGL